MVTKKTTKTPEKKVLGEKPDFKKGDRVAGELTVKVYTKAYLAKMAGVNKSMQEQLCHMDPYLRSHYLSGNQFIPQYVGDPDYEDGWALNVERKGNEEFFEVTVAPYQVKNQWHMLIESKNDDEQEVNCDDFHLIGEREKPKPPKKPLSKEILKKMSKAVSTPAIVTGVVIAVVAILFFWVIGNFNSLVTMNEDVDNSWSKVETAYQRRFDLTGNLVESVKGSQLQEQTVFKSIADARKQYASAQQSGDENGQAQAASSIETNVALIPRLQEAYPELKSNTNVQNLMGQLTGTEDGISVARNTYNDVVTNYNKGVQQFPKVVFAGLFGYHERAQFKSDSAAVKAPTVNFSSPAVTTSPAAKQ